MDLIATLFYLLIPSTENLSRLQRVILSRLRIIEVAAVVYRIGESAAVVRKQLMALRSAEQLTPSITHPCTSSAAVRLHHAFRDENSHASAASEVSKSIAT